MTEEFLPKPQTDLPLPEVELPAHAESTTTEPLPVVDGEVKGNRLKYFLLAILAIVVLAGIALGAYVLGKQSTPQITEQTAVSPSPTPIEILNTYAGDGFVFAVPDGYEIQRQTANETVWKSEIAPGNFNYATMILSSQPTAFNQNQITVYSKGTDSDEKTNETITKENENTFDIGSKMVTRYDASCGVDCIYHVAEFENNGMNYRLLFNGAGGGLSAKFDTLLESLNFSDSTSYTAPSDWKTLTKQGFSVSYPPDWKPDTNLPANTIFMLNPTEFEMPRVSLFRNFEGDWCNGSQTQESTIKINNSTNAKKWDCQHTIALEFSNKGQKYWIIADRISNDTYSTVNTVIDSIEFNDGK